LTLPKPSKPLPCFILSLPKPFPPHSWEPWNTQIPFHDLFWHFLNPSHPILWKHGQPKQEAWAAQTTPPHASLWSFPNPPHPTLENNSKQRSTQMFFLEVPRFFSIFPMTCPLGPLGKRMTPMSCAFKT
jgi:hypothetical protein